MKTHLHQKPSTASHTLAPARPFGPIQANTHADPGGGASTAAGSAHDFARVPVQAPIQRQRSRTGLPSALKAGIERLSGLPMDDVRVHYHSPRPALLQAAAFTQGTHIHVAPGEERHLPHEAWHVVQQKQGRVRANGRVAGLPLNDAEPLEREATAMGARARAVPAAAISAAPTSAPAPDVKLDGGGATAAPVQRMFGDEEKSGHTRFGSQVMNSHLAGANAVVEPHLSAPPPQLTTVLAKPKPVPKKKKKGFSKQVDQFLNGAGSFLDKAAKTGQQFHKLALEQNPGKNFMRAYATTADKLRMKMAEQEG